MSGVIIGVNSRSRQGGNRMKIAVMSLDTQTFIDYDCDDFEFRANNVSNWLRLKKDGKEIAFVNNVGVIKYIGGDR
jgi:hypothetical protein